MLIAFYQTVQEEKEEEKEEEGQFQSAPEAHLPVSIIEWLIKFICPDKHFFLFIFVTCATIVDQRKNLPYLSPEISGHAF